MVIKEELYTPFSPKSRKEETTVLMTPRCKSRDICLYYLLPHGHHCPPSPRSWFPSHKTQSRGGGHSLE